MARRPGLSARDVLVAVTTVTFDIAALELFGPLVTGGRCVIASEADVREARPLAARIARGDVTVLQATPTLWGMLLEAGLEPRPGLKMLAGGEPLPRDLADRLIAAGGEVWNMYGPTETTVWSSCGRVGEGAIDIGTPIAGTVMHVLDAQGRLAPAGVAGELNIGGAGLASGYFGRPDLTEAAFRDVDLGQGPVRLYRTGDMARRGADGALKLLGRRDGQVKLRGFRIETGEIEAAMRAVAGVVDAAVVLRDGPAGPMLAGYHTGRAEAASIAAALARTLPGYMVPARFQRLDALPLTANGKTDRRALPPLDEPATLAPVREIVAPGTEAEQALLAIWQEVLGVQAIGVTDDLFALGADSLSLFRIAARALDRGMGIEARHLIQHPTIRAVAAHAASRGDRPQAPSLRDFRAGAQRGLAASAGVGASASAGVGASASAGARP